MSKYIATIAKTNEIMSRFSIFTKKKYGQNFIIEPKIVENIARLAVKDPNTLTLEIGPGIGALTEQLAILSKQVIAFEIDNSLIEVLDYSLQDYNNVEIVNIDFLKLDFNEFMKDKTGYNQVVLAANLPYYITTPILFKVFESNVKLDLISVMVQKEVADRFSAKINTKDYNALSVIVQYLYDVKVVMNVPKTVFNPKPNVESSVVQFSKKEKEILVNNENDFFELVKACFKQRRKTLYNNLRDYYKDSNYVIELLEKTNYKQNRRAQELSLEDFIKIYEATL